MTGPYVVRHERQLDGNEGSMVCAACGETAWTTAGAYGIKHPVECPRNGWPLSDAVRYDGGSIARRSNWPHGEPHRTVVSVEAFETLEEAAAHARALIRTWRDEDGSEHAWNAVYMALHEALWSTESLPAEGGKVGLPDGSTITVEATTWVLLEDAILTADPDAKGRSIPMLPAQMWSDSGRSAALAAWNAEHAIGGER